MRDVQDMLPLFDGETSEPGSGVSYVIDTDRCMHCGDCVRACPCGAVAAGPTGRALRILPDCCIACGACHEVCPTGAIYRR